MGILREIVGFALITFAWFNPFGLELMIRILMFILGFDAMTIIPKIGIFVLDYFIGFRWLGWTLLILLAAELITALIIGKAIRLIVKPLAIFIVGFLAFGLQPALIVAGMDLILNFTISK